jgi:hypothetical protein
MKTFSLERKPKGLRKPFIIYLFIVVLGFEVRALYL